MKKNLKKLHLHRDTLVLLDPKGISPLRGALAAAIDTSCTQPCGCEPGCSGDNACVATIAVR